MPSKILTSAAYLDRLLSDFGVPTSLWGLGEAKKTQDLVKEISEGESYLRIDADGVFRIVEIVKMFLYPPPHHPARDCLLMEVGQYFPDGRYRERNQHPAGKVKRGESPKDAFLREAKEELKLDAFFEILALPVLSESRPSKSYPGLPCLYIVHGFRAGVFGMENLCHHEESTITEEDGTKHIFKWEPKSR